MAKLTLAKRKVHSKRRPEKKIPPPASSRLARDGLPTGTPESWTRARIRWMMRENAEGGACVDQETAACQAVREVKKFAGDDRV
jgi:hypothetical protein